MLQRKKRCKQMLLAVRRRSLQICQSKSFRPAKNNSSQWSLCCVSNLETCSRELLLHHTSNSVSESESFITAARSQSAWHLADAPTSVRSCVLLLLLPSHKLPGLAHGEDVPAILEHRPVATWHLQKFLFLQNSCTATPPSPSAASRPSTWRKSTCATWTHVSR